jgi:hypothetical protein
VKTTTHLCEHGTPSKLHETMKSTPLTPNFFRSAWDGAKMALKFGASGVLARPMIDSKFRPSSPSYA